MNKIMHALSFAYGQGCNAKDMQKMLFMTLKLKNAGYDNNAIAAGILSVVGNDKFTSDDISKLFGGPISSLVMASSINKDLNRKNEYNKILKSLPDTNKAIICSNIVCVLDNIIINKEELNLEDRVYYEDIFKALITDVYDERLISVLDDYYNDLNNLKSKNYDRYKASMKDIKASEELRYLKDLLNDNTKSYIIELSNNYSSKKSIKDIFIDSILCKYCTLKVKSTNNTYVNSKSLSSEELHLLVSASLKGNVINNIIDNKDIIITDEIMYEIMLFIRNMIDARLITIEDLEKILDYYEDDISKALNYTNICYADKMNINSKQISLDNEDIDEYLNIIEGDNNINSKDKEVLIAYSLLPIMENQDIKKLKQYMYAKYN